MKRYNVWIENILGEEVEFTGTYEECVKFVNSVKNEQYYKESNIEIIEEQ